MLPEGRICRMCDPGEKELIDMFMSPRADLVNRGSPPPEDEVSEESEIVSLSTSSVPVTENRPALQHDIHGPFDPENIPDEYCEGCVDEALDSYAGIHRWEHSGGAHGTYQKNWKRFISNVKEWHQRKVVSVRPKKPDRGKYKRDYERFRGIPRE